MRYSPIHRAFLIAALMLSGFAYAIAGSTAAPAKSTGTVLHQPPPAESRLLPESEMLAPPRTATQERANRMETPESPPPTITLTSTETAKIRKHPQRIVRKQRSHRGKSQKIALVLAIFLGIFGIHRFYLGYTGIGLIQMLTLGGLLIWFIVDAFRIGLGKLGPIRDPYTYRIGKQTEDEEE
jgi:TM2 domain-containing membrane protein YozV